MRAKALVTGANGMLGDAICPLLDKCGYELYLIDIAGDETIVKLDIRSLQQVMDFAKNHKPDIIFHLAAETDVDKCELDKDHAYETNVKGTENMSIISKEYGIPLVYISTAAVFDGEKEEGYIEEDTPNPISIYGKSKLKGEELICSMLTKYYIIRTGWMIGGYDKDKKFVWKIIQLLKTKKEISVVTDKIGSPTFTEDLARGIVDIVAREEYGLYHCVNKGICTRYDIAKRIAEYLGKDVLLKPVTSEVFPLPAPRGKSEALINHRLSRMNMDNMRPWQDALKEYIDEMSEKFSDISS